MAEYKETAVFHIPKENLAFMKDDSGFAEHIVKHLSYELAERLMNILDHENEIAVRQSDLRVEEYIPTDSVEYRRIIKWSPIVRCKDCVIHDICRYRLGLGENGFCSQGRKDDETD